MVHNQIHTIDLLIIAAYLIAMVLIGLVVVRKVRNMDDYYLGGRSFGPLVLMATVCATIIGGSCLLYTSPSPRDRQKSRMPSSA